MKISIFDLEKWEEKYIKKHFKKGKFFQGNLQDNLPGAKDAEIIAVTIKSRVYKKELDQIKKLKMIATMSTGYDHIDLKEARRRKIIVTNVPRYGENTVAEHTFALILTLSRKIYKTLSSSYRGIEFKQMTGFDLKGKTLGIIGGGSIGLHTARIARAFGMNVIVYDVNKKPIISELLNFEYKGLDEILKFSDIISIHAPLNNHTKYMINKNNIKKIKKGSILINTARGAIVENDALIWALQNKRLAGAGLDVIEGEEVLLNEDSVMHSKPEEIMTIYKDRKILEMDNVVFTPHNAFNSTEALHRILDTTIENINRFVNGKELKGLL